MDEFMAELAQEVQRAITGAEAANRRWMKDLMAREHPPTSGEAAAGAAWDFLVATENRDALVAKLVEAGVLPEGAFYKGS